MRKKREAIRGNYGAVCAKREQNCSVINGFSSIRLDNDNYLNARKRALNIFILEQ